MTTTQILTLCGLAVAAAVIYLPPLVGMISFSRSAPDSMEQFKAVLRIRDATNNPEVRKACSALLEALLK